MGVEKDDRQVMRGPEGCFGLHPSARSGLGLKVSIWKESDNCASV